MGAIMTAVLAILIVGYALYSFKKALTEAKKGSCTGCSSCSMKQKCKDNKHE